MAIVMNAKGFNLERAALPQLATEANQNPK